MVCSAFVLYQLVVHSVMICQVSGTVSIKTFVVTNTAKVHQVEFNPMVIYNLVGHVNPSGSLVFVAHSTK